MANSDDVQACSRCHMWRDCWVAPNGKHLCDDCKDNFGLWGCDQCNQLAPQVSFVWIGQQHMCYDCYANEMPKLTIVHTRYLKDNPDVAAYLTPRMKQ